MKPPRAVLAQDVERLTTGRRGAAVVQVTVAWLRQLQAALDAPGDQPSGVLPLAEGERWEEGVDLDALTGGPTLGRSVLCPPPITGLLFRTPPRALVRRKVGPWETRPQGEPQ